VYRLLSARVRRGGPIRPATTNPPQGSLHRIALSYSLRGVPAGREGPTLDQGEPGPVREPRIVLRGARVRHFELTVVVFWWL
jgi:hypothetical protein